MRFSLLVLPALLLAAGCDSADSGDTADSNGAYLSASTTTEAASAEASAARGSGRPLKAVLSGANEVNAAGVFGVGDPDGTGSARVTVNPGRGQVCYDITVANIDAPTRGHIHEAPAGRNGPVRVEFFEANQPAALSGCVAVTRALALEILRTPANYYVNVHNAAFPAGAVRGQLSK